MKTSVTVYGGLHYVAPESAFYFQNPRIAGDSLGRLPERLKKPTTRLIERLLEKYRSKNPIYTLSDEDTSIRAAKSVLKSVTVESGKLIVEIGV